MSLTPISQLPLHALAKIFSFKQVAHLLSLDIHLQNFFASTVVHNNKADTRSKDTTERYHAVGSASAWNAFQRHCDSIDRRSHLRPAS